MLKRYQLLLSHILNKKWPLFAGVLCPQRTKRGQSNTTLSCYTSGSREDPALGRKGEMEGRGRQASVTPAHQAGLVGAFGQGSSWESLGHAA